MTKTSLGIGASPIFTTDTQNTVTFTRPANTTQYTALDAIADSASSPTTLSFTNLISNNGEALLLTDVIITSTASPATLLTANLWLFNTDPTATNDNSAMSLTDAENLTVEAVIPLTVNFETALNSRLEAHNLNYQINQTSTTKTIYGLLQATNAYTPVSGETFVIRLKGKQL